MWLYLTHQSFARMNSGVNTAVNFKTVGVTTQRKTASMLEKRNLYLGKNRSFCREAFLQKNACKPGNIQAATHSLTHVQSRLKFPPAAPQHIQRFPGVCSRKKIWSVFKLKDHVQTNCLDMSQTCIQCMKGQSPSSCKSIPA